MSNKEYTNPNETQTRPAHEKKSIDNIMYPLLFRSHCAVGSIVLLVVTRGGI